MSTPPVQSSPTPPPPSTRPYALLILAVTGILIALYYQSAVQLSHDSQQHSSPATYGTSHLHVSSHSHSCRTTPPPLHVPSPRPRVLVTGAGGFIGSHVVDSCLKLGLEVIALDDLSGGYRSNLPADGHPHFLFIQADIRNHSHIAQIFHQFAPIHTVYHLAAYAAEGLSHFIRVYNYETNLVASTHLINQAVLYNITRFVFTSSIAVYGTCPGGILEEVTPQPEDPYGIAKYAVELDLLSAHHMWNLSYTIFRPHNVYGPRQNIHDRYRNVIGIFMNQVLRGEPLTIFGDGQQTRSFSYIDDVAPMIAHAPFIDGTENQVFNVGSDAEYSLLQLAHTVGRVFNLSQTNITFLPPRLEVQHVTANHAKLRCVFGSGEGVALDEGIKKTADWVVHHSKGMSPIEFESVEVLHNMPGSWRSQRIIQSEKERVDKLNSMKWEGPAFQTAGDSN